MVGKFFHGCEVLLARRRWVWLLPAGVLLLAGAYLAALGLAAWQERLGRHELAEDHLDEARRHVERALIVPPTRRSTTLLAARIARLRGAWAEAEHYLDRCGPRNDMAEPVQLEWLLLRCQRGEVDELAPGLLRLVEGDHAESAAILEALAGVYMRQTRYLEALPCLDRWIERASDSVRALNWRGWVCTQLDHRTQALSDYEHLLELQPSRSEVRLRLAEILVESTRHAEAVPHLEQLRNELRDNPDVAVALARCRRVQLRTDEARELLDEVLREHPDHIGALIRCAKLDLDVRRFREAERLLRNADIFCFPTFYPNENQPVNLIEAMAYGLPVLTTHWRSLPEIFPAEYPGLVDVRSLEQIADALLRLMTEDGEALRDHVDDLRRIVIWKLDGYTNAEIAALLNRTVRCVELKLQLIRKRLGSAPAAECTPA